MFEWPPLLILLDDLLELSRHRRNRLARELHRAVCAFPNDEVERAELGRLLRVVLAEVGAAAFLALDGDGRDGLGDGQEIRQIDTGVPAVVVLAVAGDADFRSALTQAVQLL